MDTVAKGCERHGCNVSHFSKLVKNYILFSKAAAAAYLVNPYCDQCPVLLRGTELFQSFRKLWISGFFQVPTPNHSSSLAEEAPPIHLLLTFSSHFSFSRPYAVSNSQLLKHRAISRVVLLVTRVILHVSCPVEEGSVFPTGISHHSWSCFHETYPGPGIDSLVKMISRLPWPWAEAGAAAKTRDYCSRVIMSWHGEKASVERWSACSNLCI